MNKRTRFTSKNVNLSKAITPPSNFLKLFIAAVFALALAFSAWAAAPLQAFAATSTQEMYRLYNPYSGEHLYTLSTSEYNSLGKIGWRQEGIAWMCPKTSNTPVYRLYNPYSGDHHYTTSRTEYNNLGKIGWRQEGIGFYSADASNGVAVYRLFNPYVTVGTHHYTKDANEYNYLGKIGWNKENIAWYGLSSGGTTNPTSPTSPTTPGTKTYTVYFSLPSVGGAALKDASLQKQTLKVGETPKDPGLTFSDATYRFDGWSKTLNEVAEASKKGTTWFNLSATYHRYTQYDYEVYLVSDKEFLSTPVATEFDNGSGNEGMQQYSYPLFIKTNNPNSDIQLDVLDSEGNSVVEYRYETNYGFTQYNDDRFSYSYHDTYCDIVYADNNAKASLQKNKVDGGFVYDLRIKKAGTYTLKITEESYNVGRLVYRIQGPSFTINVKDWTEAENAWIDAQIAKYTTSDMNSNEKLAAIAKGLDKDFSYLTYSYIGGMERRVAYTTDVGAYFQNYHWDSLVSPTVLCKIAQRLGGFEKIENLYYGDSWSAHDLCRVTYEGTTYTYSACPSLSTGEVAIDDIFNRPKVDLTNTSALRKLTKIAS